MPQSKRLITTFAVAVTPSATVTFAGKLMFLVESRNVKFPLMKCVLSPSAFASQAVISNLAVGNFAVLKKSSAAKCPCNLVKFSSGNESVHLIGPAKFELGDGIVTADSADMPVGYSFTIIESKSPHPNLLNDVYAIEKALSCCGVE